MITSFAQVFDAITANEVDAVSDYISEHPEIVNAKTFFAGGTLLHFAAAHSSPKMIKSLVSQGFDVNHRGATYGDTPLHAAATHGAYENAETLLSLGATLDVSESYRNPLFGAIIANSPDLVRLLLAAGIDSGIVYTLEDGSVVDALGFARKRGTNACAEALLARVH